jgi:hypothetical protein
MSGVGPSEVLADPWEVLADPWEVLSLYYLLNFDIKAFNLFNQFYRFFGRDDFCPVIVGDIPLLPAKVKVTGQFLEFILLNGRQELE